MAKLKPNQDNIDRHNEVTRVMLVGLMADLYSGKTHTDVSHEIMSLLQRRGYQPQIRSCNQLANGKAC
jgi:mannitol/fructose-specific phosphotransferase system IIA component (Ntr-type)